MPHMLNSPVTRLVGRAILSGIVAAAVLYQADASAWKGAIVAGVLAASEALTPLNASVGVGKQDLSETPVAPPGYMK